MSFDEDVLELAAITAGVHRQCAADRAGYAAQEFHSLDAGIGGRACDRGIERRGTRLELCLAGRLDAPERGRKPDHDSGDSAIADEQVRADADHAYGQIGGLFRHERAEVLDVRRPEQNVSSTAGAEPDEVLERRLLGIRAAHFREDVERSGHGAAPFSFSAASMPLAQVVIEPAPRNTTAPPGFASPPISAGRSSGPSMVTTFLWPCARNPSARLSRLMPSIGASPAG